MRRNVFTYSSVDDLLEVNCHCTVGDTLVIFAIVDEDTDFLGSDFVGTVTKHKQHGVNDI